MLKKFKATTSSQRNLIRIKYENINKFSLLKCKIIGLKNNAGKNNSGKITISHKGNGVKKKYKKINFLRKKSSTGIVLSLEYDPNRNTNVAAIYDYLNKRFYYIIKPKNLKVGHIIKSGKNAEIKIGHSLTISKIPVGSFLHCISAKPGKNATLSRSAGTFVQLLEKNKKYGRIRLPSKEQRYLKLDCLATIGTVSNELKMLTKIGKAGRNRWLNNRPTVRGVAMNPVDHPHGGGEGKTSGGRTSVTPWGKPAKHKKTSKSKNKLIILKRK